MNKKYYFRHFLLSLAIGLILSYKIFSEPLTEYKQYIFLIWVIINIFLYPISHYTLEKIYSYLIPLKITKNKFINNPDFFRMREYFCFFISFLLSIPIILFFIGYKLFKK